MKKFYVVLIASILLVSLYVPAAIACNCDEPVIIDGLEAYDRSRREGRDIVEGFWGIYLDWQPEAGANRSYRMAVVKNDYEGVYPEVDYIGVVTCDQPGCTRGEVKLLLTKTDDPDKFEAVLLVTDVDGAKGTATLKTHEDTKREDSLLDMSEMKYQDKLMTYGMVRIIGG
jgi:hypothetical protein